MTIAQAGALSMRVANVYVHAQRTVVDDANRLRSYLNRCGISWHLVHALAAGHVSCQARGRSVALVVGASSA